MKLPQGGSHRTVRGEATEALALHCLLRAGWEMAKPFGHAHSYDFVGRLNGGAWQTIQVKAAYLELRGGPRVKLRRSLGRSYAEGQVDWFCLIYGPHFWMIPWAVVANESSVHMNHRVWDSYKRSIPL